MKFALLSILNSISFQKINYWKVKLFVFWEPQPLWLKVIWSLSALFIFLFVMFFIVLIIRRFIKNIEEERTKKVRYDYQNALSSFLFGEFATSENLVEKKQEIIQLFGKKNLKRKFSRHILFYEIVALSDNYSGETNDHLKALFKVLNLDQIVLQKLRSRKWSTRAEGINIAARMNLVELESYVSMNLNNSNPTIRAEAYVASIRLNQEHPLGFFENLKYEVTRWEQIQMHAALQAYSGFQLPEMEQWTTHRLDSIVIFSLRMIGFYGQESAVNSVMILIGHKSVEVKLQAIKTLGELRTKLSLVVLLNDMYQNLNNKRVLKELLKALTLIQIRNKDFDRFDRILEMDDYETTFLAISALLSAPDGYDFVHNLSPNLTEKQQLIVKQLVFEKTEYK